MKRLWWGGGIFVVIMAVIVARSVFLVPEGRQAKLDDDMTWLEPGLHWHSPWRHQLTWQDQRQQAVLASGTDDQPYVRVITFDQKQLELGYMALWQVTDRAVFAKHYGSDAVAKNAVRTVINQALSQCCLSETLAQWLTADSLTTNAHQVLTIANTILAANGLTLSQLVITAVTIPSEARDVWLDAMQVRGQANLTQLQLQTTTLAATLKATVDAKASKMVTDAQRQADALRSQADTEAAAIYANAYQKNPEFYEFYMNLNAYQHIFKARSPVMVLDSQSSFFKSMHP